MVIAFSTYHANGLYSVYFGEHLKLLYNFFLLWIDAQVSENKIFAVKILKTQCRLWEISRNKVY